MKATKRSLIVSIAILCVCALSLTSASFAWFTASNKAQVGGINLSVAEHSSLEITVTGAENVIGWNSTLSAALLQQAGVYYYTEIAGSDAEYTVLNDASTGDLVNWTKANYNESSNSFTFVSATGESANSANKEARYLELPITFRSTKEGTVKFSSDSAVSLGTQDLAPALRVGYVDKNSTASIYSEAGTGAKYQTVGGTGETDLDLSGTIAEFIANTEIELTKATADDTYATAEVVFYIWIEGTDPACINENTPADFGLTYKFELTTGE